MQNLNEVRFIGHLGADPVKKEITADFKVATFNLATKKTWDKENGEKGEATQWHFCELRNGLADIAEKFLSKGSCVHLSGELVYDKFIPSGETKEVTRAKIIVSDFIFLDKKGDK